MSERHLVNITITMTREERIALRQLAAAKEKTVSALVRDWLRESQKKVEKATRRATSND